MPIPRQSPRSSSRRTRPLGRGPAVEHVLDRGDVARVDTGEAIAHRRRALEAGPGGQSTGRDDHDVGSRSRDPRVVDECVQPQIDVELSELPCVPVDVVEHLLTARLHTGQPVLTTDLWAGLDDDDSVAALGTDARDLQPGGSGTDDEHGLGLFRRHEPVATPDVLTAG